MELAYYSRLPAIEFVHSEDAILLLLRLFCQRIVSVNIQVWNRNFKLASRQNKEFNISVLFVLIKSVNQIARK